MAGRHGYLPALRKFAIDIYDTDVDATYRLAGAIFSDSGGTRTRPGYVYTCTLHLCICMSVNCRRTINEQLADRRPEPVQVPPRHVSM